MNKSLNEPWTTRLARFLALCLLAGVAMGAGLMLMTLLGLEVLKRMVP